MLVITEPPENTREDDLGLRLGPDLGIPFDAVRILHVVLGAETGGVAFLERVGRIWSRSVLLAADSPEEVARFTSWIDPELPDRLRRWRPIGRLDRNRTAARGGTQCDRDNG